MHAIRIVLTSAIALAICGSVLAADVPGTRSGGRSAQEPPPPQREGNPFPRNPGKPLTNPLRDDRRDMNPRNDPDVARGIRENYERHNAKKK